MHYAAAVKQYFATKGEKVHFPKKGSAEHAAIRALMASGDMSKNNGTTAARTAAGDATASSSVSAAAAPLQAKARKARAKKAAPAPSATTSDATPTKPNGTTLLDQPHLTKQAVAEVIPEAEKAPIKKRKPRAVKANGLPPEAINLKNATEMNSATVVAPADYPDLEKQLKKVLDVKPEGIPERPKKREKTIATESKTLKGDKTDDPKALEMRAPFSFASIKQLLRQ